MKMNSVSIPLPKKMTENVVSSLLPSSLKMDLYLMLSLKEAQIEQRKYFGMIYNFAIIENDRKISTQFK